MWDDDEVHDDTASNQVHPLMWDHDDVLEFVPDHLNSRIIIRNKSREDNETTQ